MKIEEQFLIEAPIAEVWAFVRNPTTVAPCIPGCESVEPLSDNRYRAAIVVALGPVKARFNVVVEITEESPPSRLVCSTKGEEGGKASMVSAISEIRFAERSQACTEVLCKSEVSIIGRLGKFGLGIVKKRANHLAGEFAAAVRQRVQIAHA